MTAKTTTRREDLHAFKRQRILEAAATLFRANGLEGTTMRAIAGAAGYSTGAPYAYYRSKEEIFADLVSQSLADASRAIKQATRPSLPARALIRAVFTAFYKYYSGNPAELQLCLSLYSGPQSGGGNLPAEIDARLNSRLMALLGSMANALHTNTHLGADDAQSQTLACFSFMIGVLALEGAGRLDVLGTGAQEMVDRYMDRMLTSAGT